MTIWNESVGKSLNRHFKNESTVLPAILFLILILGLSLSIPGTVFGGEEQEQVLRLKIGDRNLSEKTMEVRPDAIYSAQKGKPVSFSRMIDEMKNARLVYVGETHNNLPMHDVQLKIIRDLHKRGEKLSIGMEMFPVGHQEVLDKWSRGTLDQCSFIRESRWYVTWNFNFGFYDKIFSFARDNRIPIHALNVPRDLISKIRMKGWEALSDEEKTLVPRPDLGHEEHRLLIRTIFEAAELPQQMKGAGLDMMFEGLYRAQSAWDEAMAFHALRAMEKDGGKMVILAGLGHLLYNLGINRHAHERSRLPFKTVVCVVIPRDQESITVSRSLADYVWGLAGEERPAFPSVGLSFTKFNGLDKLVIERDPIDGVARGRDFKKGDIVLSVDGKSFSDINELRIYLSRFTWGDTVKFRLLRQGLELEAILEFSES